MIDEECGEPPPPGSENLASISPTSPGSPGCLMRQDSWPQFLQVGGRAGGGGAAAAAAERCREDKSIPPRSLLHSLLYFLPPSPHTQKKTLQWSRGEPEPERDRKTNLHSSLERESLARFDSCVGQYGKIGQTHTKGFPTSRGHNTQGIWRLSDEAREMLRWKSSMQPWVCRVGKEHTPQYLPICCGHWRFTLIKVCEGSALDGTTR